MRLSRNDVGMIAFPIGAIAVLIARFGFDLLPVPRPVHLRDFGPVMSDVVNWTFGFLALTGALFILERRMSDDRAERMVFAARIASLGATIASVAVVVFWLFAFSVGMLCDAGPDC